MPSGRNPIVFGTAADSPRLSHVRFLPPLIFQQQNARGYYAARICLPNKPQVGCTRLAAVRLIAECAVTFPLVSDCPHICCLHNQPSEVECVRQIKTTINPVRLKNFLPLRTARMPTITLPLRGFGCCTPKTTSSPRHYLRDPPPSQVRLPPVIRLCPPAKRTYCSRVLSLHTFRRALRKLSL